MGERTNTEFKVFGIYRDNELVGIATSEASLKAKLVSLGDPLSEDHDIESFGRSEHEITESHKSQTQRIKRLKTKLKRLETELEKIKDKSAKEETVKTELEKTKKDLKDAEELQEMLTSGEHNGTIFVLYDTKTDEPFTTQRKIKDRKGKERLKTTYYVYGDYKSANNGLRLKPLFTKLVEYTIVNN